MTDTHVLGMPSRRFWSMEAQIARIKAEDSLKSMVVSASANSKEAMNRTVESLTLEIGETYRVVRPKIVAPERDIDAKFARVGAKRVQK